MTRPCKEWVGITHPHQRTLARRLATEIVKANIRSKGNKISHVEAKTIRIASNKLAAKSPEIIAEAIRHHDFIWDYLTTHNPRDLP